MLINLFSFTHLKHHTRSLGSYSAVFLWAWQAATAKKKENH